MAFLIGMSATIKGQKFDLEKDITTIGRSQSNDIVLTNNAVSSQHCYISHRDNRYVLHDSNSTNGTKLNFESITEVDLLPKQVIQIGSIELMVDGDSSEFPNVKSITAPTVIIDNAPPVAIPMSFSSVSPFGRRREKNKTVWLTVIIAMGLSALAGVIFFIIKIF